MARGTIIKDMATWVQCRLKTKSLSKVVGSPTNICV